MRRACWSWCIALTSEWQQQKLSFRVQGGSGRLANVLPSLRDVGAELYLTARVEREYLPDLVLVAGHVLLVRGRVVPSFAVTFRAVVICLVVGLVA